MTCLKCGNGRARVVDSREVELGKIMRIRECDSCSYRFKTYEIMEDLSKETGGMKI